MAMRSGTEPEILPPEDDPGMPREGNEHGRLGSGADRLFRDENLDLLSSALDTWFRIPGTTIRFGLDGIIRLVPGFGDVIAGLASAVIVIAAWVRGAPYITIARMLLNLTIDVVIGAIPFLGDAFDIAWRANRRNYALLVKHIEAPRHHHWADWLFLLSIGLVLCVLLAIPGLVLAWLLHAAFGTGLHLL